MVERGEVREFGWWRVRAEQGADGEGGAPQGVSGRTRRRARQTGGKRVPTCQPWRPGRRRRRTGGGGDTPKLDLEDRGDIKATREGEDTPKLDLVDQGDTEATREGEDTPKLDLEDREDIKATGEGEDTPKPELEADTDNPGYFPPILGLFWAILDYLRLNPGYLPPIYRHIVMHCQSSLEALPNLKVSPNLRASLNLRASPNSRASLNLRAR